MTWAALHIACVTTHTVKPAVTDSESFVTGGSHYVITQAFTFITRVTWVTLAGNLLCPVRGAFLCSAMVTSKIRRK